MKILDIWSEAELRVENCWHCWQYSKYGDYAMLDNDYYLEHWDEILALLDALIYKADSYEMHRAAEILSVSFLYQGCFSSYFTAYENDDAETMAKLEERYELLCRRIGNRAGGRIKGDFEHYVYDDLHKTAWNLWLDERKYFFPEGTQLKPVPQEYVIAG